MSSSSDWNELEQKVQRFRDTPVWDRFLEAKEACGAKLDCFWFRGSSDIVNAAWLTDRTIFDVTWFPIDESSYLITAGTIHVSDIETRTGTEAARKTGYPVAGDYVVTLTMGGRTRVGWAAETGDESRLAAFALAVRLRCFETR